MTCLEMLFHLKYVERIQAYFKWEGVGTRRRLAWGYKSRILVSLRVLMKVPISSQCLFSHLILCFVQ